jgi:hypothetical protein
LDLDNLTADMLRQALALYLREAFPDGVPEEKRPMIRLPLEGTLPEILAASAFEPVSMAEDDTSRPDIWKLPIGSVTSDRMKFCLKRVSLSEEFLFNVDIHDLYLGGDREETERERTDREASERLKQRVEESWAAAGLPTFVKYMEDYLNGKG